MQALTSSPPAPRTPAPRTPHPAPRTPHPPLACQAVHDPFGDSDDRYGKGIPKEYMESSRYAYIANMVEGNINQVT